MQAIINDDRRDDKRHKAILRIGIVRSRFGNDLCLVKNLSSGGLMARVHRVMPIDEALTFELREGQRLDGTLRWARDGHIGVEFVEPISVETILAVQDNWACGNRPRTPRVAIDQSADLMVADHHYPVVLRNISLGGAGIALPEPIKIIGPVQLAIPGLQIVHGQIRWSRDDISGMSFNQALSFDRLAAWVTARPPG